MDTYQNLKTTKKGKTLSGYPQKNDLLFCFRYGKSLKGLLSGCVSLNTKFLLDLFLEDNYKLLVLGNSKTF